MLRIPGAINNTYQPQQEDPMSFLSGGFGAIANIGGTLLQNNWNKRAAQNQMDYQTEMSNTAHQREVKDLIAAGLNPTLSAGGNGSSTPSGAMPNMQAPQIDMPAIFSMINQSRQLDQNDQRIEIDRNNSAANIANKESATAVNKVKKELYQKGMPRALIEGEAAKVLQHYLPKSNALINKLP